MIPRGFLRLSIPARRPRLGPRYQYLEATSAFPYKRISAKVNWLVKALGNQCCMAWRWFPSHIGPGLLCRQFSPGSIRPLRPWEATRLEHGCGAHRDQRQRNPHTALSHLHTRQCTIYSRAQKDGHSTLKHRERIVCKLYIK